MKNKIFKIGVFSTLLIGSLAYSQKTEDIKIESKGETDKSLLVKTDSVAIAEAKKKAAAEEKAKLPKPYDAKANAEADIAKLVAQAKKENKNIILQAGGNWCIWCLRFNNFVQETPELKEIVDKNYLYYHLNFSPENKNEKIFAKFGNPGEKYGYPVFIVLDKNGKQIHTQDSAVLEEGKGYSIEKVKEFFNTWVPKS
ncbi:thioredoxin family protein [uncultured Chryseobacterium sp.]|uniref:thioredoxin family protein n=1 Tax=uncultured Chryseobacterium sp. TaxID=259322 RepID=UPI00263286A6|nr:thioredoxin family protein [uncultured Chryseobacterium sp.]